MLRLERKKRKLISSIRQQSSSKSSKDAIEVFKRCVQHVSPHFPLEWLHILFERLDKSGACQRPKQRRESSVPRTMKSSKR